MIRRCRKFISRLLFHVKIVEKSVDQEFRIDCIFINANLLTTVKRSLILKVKNLREYHGHAHLTPVDNLD